MITKDTVQSAFNLSHFSNEKIKKELNYEFIPVEQSIKEVAALFLKDIREQR